MHLEGQQKGIEAIGSLKKLEKIVLRSISTSNVDYLKNSEHLWSVDIKLGGIKDLSGLAEIPNLKYLELWQVRGLADLSFISKLENLQYLFIQSQKQLNRLLDFSNNRKLKRNYLENLNGLKDLSTLKSAPNLKEFIYVLAGNQEPNSFIPISENPSVEMVFCRFGSDKKNNRFAELAKLYKKAEYLFGDFEFE